MPLITENTDKIVGWNSVTGSLITRGA